MSLGEGRGKAGVTTGEKGPFSDHDTFFWVLSNSLLGVDQKSPDWSSFFYWEKVRQSGESLYPGEASWVFSASALVWGLWFSLEQRKAEVSKSRSTVVSL